MFMSCCLLRIIKLDDDDNNATHSSIRLFEEKSCLNLDASRLNSISIEMERT